MAYEHEKDPRWQAEIAARIDELLGGKPADDSGRKKKIISDGSTIEFGPADDDTPCPGCGKVHPPGMGGSFHMGFSAEMDPAYQDQMADQVRKIGDASAAMLKIIAENIPFGAKAIELALLRRAMQGAQTILRNRVDDDHPLIRAHVDHLTDILRSMEKLERAIDVLPKEMWEGLGPKDIPGFGGGSGYADPTGE